jgi:hypothetical protein
MREQSLLSMHLCVHKPRREPSDGREEAKLNERKIAKSFIDTSKVSTWPRSRLTGQVTDRSTIANSGNALAE